MADFKQQFGLDYLGVKAASPVPSRSADPVLPQGLGDAVFAYGGKVLEALQAEPSGTLSLFEIARRLGTRVDTLSPVLRLLAVEGYEGYVEKTFEDPLGDDKFRLTDSGKKVAAT
jgi:hypothetical protein